jgi:hypothetical protein
MLDVKMAAFEGTIGSSSSINWSSTKDWLCFVGFCISYLRTIRKMFSPTNIHKQTHAEIERDKRENKIDREKESK